MKKEIMNYMLNGIDPIAFYGCIGFAALGVIVSLLLGALTRKPSDPRTPEHFSLSFFLSDNFKRMVLSILLNIVGIPLLIIFSKKLLNLEPEAWTGLVIGFFFDLIVGKAMKVKQEAAKKINDFELPFLNHTETMNYWDLTFRNETDEVVWPSGNKSLGEFANATAGTLSGKVVTYTSDPGFTSVDIIDANDLKSYTAGPIKRPM